MNKQLMQDYIEKKIPLTKAMQVSVIELSHEKIILSAPLEVNFNHKCTAFGGSIMALQALAGWGYLMNRLTSDGFKTEIVIHKSEVKFSQPVKGDFTAIATSPSPEKWQQFTDTLNKKGKARIALTVDIHQQDSLCSTLKGHYVAIAL